MPFEQPQADPSQLQTKSQEISLSQQATSGVRWSAVSRIGGQGLQFVTLAVLARLLSPNDLGLVNIATVVVGFVTIFKDLGTSAAIVQQKDLSHKLLSSVFWVNVLFGLTAAIVLFVASPWIAYFYREERVVPFMRVLALTFVLTGPGILQQALLQRALAFERLALVDVVANLAGASVGIGAALLGAGAWSLILQSLVTVAVTTGLLWLVSVWRPGFRLRWAELRPVSGYSLNLTGFNVFNYFARNVDYVLIGRFLGTQALGYYTLAYQIMLYPVQGVSGIVGRVTFPTLSQIQDDDARFRRAYLRVVSAISLLTFPLAFSILALSGPLIVGVFGEKWQPAVPVLTILALVGLAQSIGTTVGSIYQAKGRTDWMLRWGLVAGVIRAIAFSIGLRWGIVGVAAMYAMTDVMLMYPNYAIPFKLINLRVNELLKWLWPSLSLSLVMFAAMVGIRLVWEQNSGVGPIPLLLGCTTAGAAIYSGLLLWRRPKALFDALELLPVQWLTWLRRLSAR